MLGLLMRKEKDRDRGLEEKLKTIETLDIKLAEVERNHLRMKDRFELKLRETDRRRRATEKKLELCSNEIEAELYRKEIDGYVQSIDELKERLKAIIARIAKMRRVRAKLDLLKTDIEATLMTNVFGAIERFIKVFSKGDVKDFNENFDYQLDRLEEELDRTLINTKEREYSWLDEEVEVEKEKEKEGVPA